MHVFYHVAGVGGGGEFPGGLAVKDSVLSPLWLWLDPWPGNLCMMQAHTRKKKDREEKERRCESAEAAITQYHRQGGLNNRNLFSRSSSV